MDATDDAATIGQLQALAAGFNQTVNGLAALGALTAEESAMRQLSWSAGMNSVLVNDESLTDLGPLWDTMVVKAQLDATTRAQLEPFRMARQAVSDSEIVPLSAQAVLGEAVSPATPTAVWGVTVPLSDEYFLTGGELQAFEIARATVNAAIVSAVTAVGDDRVAIADFNGYFEGLATAAPFAQMNTAVTYDFAPPTGMFSTDGIHPNARGYGLIANKFFAAINEKFGSTIPDLKVGNFLGAPLPVTVE